jgi:hypothetical protein
MAKGLIFFPLLLLSSAAAAQVVSDCEYAPFTLREYPAAVVADKARAATGDRDNTFVVDVYARCDKGSPWVVYVCGWTVQRLRTGYVTNRKAFFGVWNSRTDLPKGAQNFLVTYAGDAALRQCAQNVFNAE